MSLWPWNCGLGTWSLTQPPSSVMKAHQDPVCPSLGRYVVGKWVHSCPLPYHHGLEIYPVWTSGRGIIIRPKTTLNSFWVEWVVHVPGSRLVRGILWRNSAWGSLVVWALDLVLWTVAAGHFDSTWRGCWWHHSLECGWSCGWDWGRILISCKILGYNVLHEMEMPNNPINYDGK